MSSNGKVIIVLIIFLIVIVSMSVTLFRHYKILNVDEVTRGMSYKKFLKKASDLLEKNKKRFMIIYIDINDFKYINNMFGYQVGNDILYKTSELIKAYANEFPYARIYADHFVLIVENDDFQQFKDHLTQIESESQKYFGQYYDKFHVSFKIGIYEINEEKDIKKLINYANYAVDALDNTSKNQICFYDKQMYVDIVNRQEIEKDMESALINGEFEVYYQPKINISNQTIVGAEALVRWNHSKKGLMAPILFIPIFEKNGFIIEIDLYVFECVCKMLNKRIIKDEKIVPISCNFSRLHLMNQNFIHSLMNIIKKYDIPTEYLELEITETVATEDFDKFANVVSQIKEKGFLLSIDDFGSGYSSIQLLHKLPIDYLKIDKTYIQNTKRNQIEDDLIKSIIEICHNHHINIVCEGVETKEQEEFLKTHDCYLAQGYLYSKPLPLDVFETMLL